MLLNALRQGADGIQKDTGLQFRFPEEKEEEETELPTEGETELPTEGETELPTEGETELPTEEENELPAKDDSGMTDWSLILGVTIGGALLLLSGVAVVFM